MPGVPAQCSSSRSALPTVKAGTAETGVTEDELGDIASELYPRDVIDPRVLTGEDAAQAGLRRRVGIAGEGPDDPGQCGRADPDVVAVAEERREHSRAGRAD